MHQRQQALFCLRTMGINVGDAQPYMNSGRSAVHIVRTEQSMRGWIVRGSPGVLPCRTGWQPLCVIPLPATQSLDHCPSLPTDMLERVLFCLGHCLAGHQKDRFSLGNGLTSAVASAGCRGRGSEKCNPRLRWKTALTIALLRAAKSDKATQAGRKVACTYKVSLAAPSARFAPGSSLRPF